MSDTHNGSAAGARQKGPMERAVTPPSLILRSLLRLAVVNALMLWGLLASAGRYDWPEAWWCIGVLFAGLVLSVLLLWRTNPELIAARQGFGSGTKAWDYLMIAILIGGTAILLWTAGFDERWRWSAPPAGVATAGLAVMILGLAGAAWAQAANRHFEPSVRLQSDRAHAVVEAGPYALVRHPGYVSGALILIGMALALGSLWALIPAFFAVAALVLRTVLEDRTLCTELAGYAAYTRRVRYRWVPGIW